MDPSKPDSFNHRTEKLDTGRTYHFVDQLPERYDSKRTVTLLLLHGFPDLWYVGFFSVRDNCGWLMPLVQVWLEVPD
jgi:hypothetical protein